VIRGLLLVVAVNVVAISYMPQYHGTFWGFALSFAGGALLAQYNLMGRKE
jgi:hypothetical protein